MKYRYSLEKYKGPNTRHECPICHEKELVRYIDNETGQHLSDNIGRCNREQECGYHKTPREYLGRRPNFMDKIPRPAKYFKPSYITVELFRSTLNDYTKNNFVLGLKKLFNQQIINSLVTKYFIGTNNNKVIFWQIDQSYKVRTGKSMNYSIETLKRKGNPNWIHTIYKLKSFHLNQCLFGLHLLDGLKKNTPIFIVESEKTAVIMSGYYSDLVWLATGGLQNLKMELLNPIHGFPIYLFPDIGAEQIWAEKSKEFPNIHLVDWPSALNINTELHRGKDIADFYQTRLNL